jgi:hypothetical protein
MSEFNGLNGSGVGGALPKGLEKTALKKMYQEVGLQNAKFAGSKQTQEDIEASLNLSPEENQGSQIAVRSIRDSQFVSIETASTTLIDALTVFSGSIKNYSGGSGVPQKAVTSLHLQHHK